MNNQSHKIKKKLIKMPFLLQLIKYVSGSRLPDFSWSFLEGISDEFGCRDECIHLFMCTWGPHATDDAQGFLSHALNTGSLGEDVQPVAALMG